MDRKASGSGRRVRCGPMIQGFVAACAFNLIIILLVTSHNRQQDASFGAGSDRKLLLPQRHAADSTRAMLARSALTSDVWARGSASADASLAAAVRANLSKSELEELREICGRCLYHSFTKYVTVMGINGPVFVATGDIPDMWIRDSSVQMGIYLPRISKHPILRHVIEGTLRTQAYFILIDPWANAFSQTWRETSKLSRFERLIGRGGWVATRNFELDSGAYFMNFLWNYYTSGVFNPEALLNEPLLYDAVSRMVDVWTIETTHEELSPYRYSELPRDGMGSPVAFTGMVWSGFRASDDPTTYGYNIPANMYAAGALERVVEMNKQVWRSDTLATRASSLLDSIRKGLSKHGTVEVPEYGLIYAYEVDGLGGVLHSTDDPNLPSLLAVPILGYKYFDAGVYANTKKVLYSTNNPFWFKGKEVEGLGSTHTPSLNVWPLAHMVLGLMTPDAAGRSETFRALLKMQGDNGLMHESVNVNNPMALTRPEFEWANAMFVTFFESTLGEDCDGIAEAMREADILAHEPKKPPVGVLNVVQVARNGGDDVAKYFDLLEFSLKHTAR